MPSTFEPVDVNRDGHVSEVDAVMVISSLNRPRHAGEAFEPAMDVNQDGKLSPIDALLIINRLGDDWLIDQPPTPGITSEETFTIDNTAPTVAISRQTPSAEVTNADSVTFLLNFSEDVVNVTADDFEVAASGVTTGEITVGDKGDSDASTYSVSIASIRGDGVLDLDFARAQDITDRAGNPFSPHSEDPASSIRGQAYTELIAVTVNPATGSVTTEVWGTQGTDTSPEAAALIDLETAAQQLGATRVILNGPRYLLADAGTLTPGEAPIQTFGDLEMQLIGSIELDLASPPTSLESAPYVPQTVSRNTDSIYYAGSEIYQLTSPAGEMYVMQSTVTEIENADLAGLGDRLTLPEGWVFEVITLEEPLRVTVSDGDTIDVLVDDLGNAYGYVGIDPLRYHDGYFVGDINIPGFPPGAKAHQDVYVDYETERVTVYAQTRVGDQIFAPPQIGPGETTTLPNGQPVSFHPDAVYLNGSGQELMENDGTGQWWIKHSWVNGGEGYFNSPGVPAAEYPELYVEGDYFQGGPTIRIGGTTPETESYYNLREPLVGGDPNAFRVSRYEPANDDPTVGPIDLTPTERFSFDLYRTEAVSAFDGSQRTPIGEPADPTPVASLTANPNPAPTGSNITLTATPVVTAAQVVFFRESNGTPGLQNTDTPVGTDTNGADGWTASVNVGSTPGTFTYYAVPLIANSPVGTPMVTTIIVQGGVETAIPNEPADQVYTTADGVEFVRTPDEQFENLPDWPYEPKYVEIDGLRQAYIDEGPEDGPVVLLLHGQPSWSYLYRDMIPVLVDAGYRVIAMDHLGMGRSDKPTDVDYYTYEVHTDRLEQFIVELGLEDINLFAQDWGSLIGLHVAGENPEWFASIAIGNGALPVIPAGTQPFPPVLDTDAIVDVPSPFTLMPAQQVPFRDADGELIGQGPAGAFGDAYFGNWMNFAMTGASFKPSDVLEALTWFDIPADEQAAYDAPFPSRAYMAGPRSFPSVINSVPGANDQAWAGLGAYDKPFVTIWGGNDPGNLGRPEVQQQLIDHVPGADGQPHTRLPEASHFLQDDQGEEIATQLVAFYQANGIEGVDTVEEEPTRYIDSIFETTISEDIVYATVDGQELLLNVITPQGDTETDRPLIIIANGGAFAFTDREQIIPVAEQFAEAGYVAVVMSYRTQGGPTFGEDFRYAAVDATHDMIGAVRFMKANAETFGIDPNKVIVGGASAGAVMAASVGTTDPDDPMSDELAAYLETVGGVYGNVGEHLDQSPAVQGVFAISGAIFGLDTIDANSAPIYAVHNELDPVAPCGSVGGSGSGIPASGTCDFIPVFQAAGVPAHSFIVPGDTGHVQFSQEEWQQFTAEALEFFFTHVVNESGEDGPGADVEILSANIGVLDIPIPQPLANITGVEQQAGDDGMPMVFSVPIDATTLSYDDFLITTASGATTRPTVATLEPAPESDESTTVLLAGPLGSAGDLPVSVEIVGSVKSVDGEELRGLTSEITMDGSELVVALADPAETNAAGNEVTPTRIQLTFNGGVTGPSNAEQGVEELLAFRIIDEDGNSHIPTGFEDLGDNDNYVVLLVPPGVTPASVTVQSNTLFSPMNQPNAASSIEISGTIDLNDDEHEELTLGGQHLEPSLRRLLLTRRIVAQVHEAVGAHCLANLLPVRMMSGVRGSANSIGRATSLAPALVDAALQSDGLADPAELLLSTLATQRIPDGLRGALGRLRR